MRGDLTANFLPGAAMNSLTVVFNALPAILAGSFVTIGNVTASLAMGLVLGVPLAVGQVYGGRGCVGWWRCTSGFSGACPFWCCFFSATACSSAWACLPIPF